MTKEFRFKRGNLDNLARFYRKSPKILRRAAVGMTNNLAFTARGFILEELERSMTIRSPGFVKGSVRVKKATFGDRKAKVGSIKRERFTGWMEQETGKKTDRKRVQTLVARRSNWRNRVAPRFRLKPGSKKFIRPSDLGLKDNQIVPFLQILDKRKYKQPYFIPVAYKRLQCGIYIFRANKIRRVQTLDPKDQRVERDQWMTRSVRRLDAKTIKREWRKSLSHNLKKAGYTRRRI